MGWLFFGEEREKVLGVLKFLLKFLVSSWRALIFGEKYRWKKCLLWMNCIRVSSHRWLAHFLGYSR